MERERLKKKSSFSFSKEYGSRGTQWKELERRIMERLYLNNSNNNRQRVEGGNGVEEGPE